MKKIVFISPVTLNFIDWETGEECQYIPKDEKKLVKIANNINLVIFNEFFGKLRGLAEYDDGLIDMQVFSIQPRVVVKDGSLVCETVVWLFEEIEENKIEDVKDYITGQYSDGWGEGFEQEPIWKTKGDVSIYAHFWQFEGFSLEQKKEITVEAITDALKELNSLLGAEDNEFSNVGENPTVVSVGNPSVMEVEQSFCERQNKEEKTISDIKKMLQDYIALYEEEERKNKE